MKISPLWLNFMSVGRKGFQALCHSKYASVQIRNYQILTFWKMSISFPWDCKTTYLKLLCKSLNCIIIFEDILYAKSYVAAMAATALRAHCAEAAAWRQWRQWWLCLRGWWHQGSSRHRGAYQEGSTLEVLWSHNVMLSQIPYSREY